MIKRISVYIPSTIFCVIIFLKTPFFDKELRVIAWDTFGYYLYLPSIFLEDDIALQKFDHYDTLVKKYNASSTLYQISKSENGHNIYKYTGGWSVLMSPFYFLADFITKNFTRFPRDGMSYFYQLFILLGGFFYTVIGAFLIPKILAKFFSNRVTLFVSIIFLFGTSYFYEAAHSSLMPHNILFVLYTLILLITINYWEKKKRRDLILIGVLIGLLALSRPTEAIVGVIPLFWGVTDFGSLKMRFSDLFRRKTELLAWSLIPLLVLLPQLLYWKFWGGSWLITDYGNPAEGLDFFSPHILDTLFSFRKGWFIYTPVALLSFLGFILSFRKGFFGNYSLIIFWILNVYIVSAWSCWWYANSFSMRAFVQSSVLLIVPLGFLVEFLIDKRRLALSLFGILIILNQFQIFQMEKGIIHGDRMTMSYYFKIFGKTQKDNSWDKLLLIERSTDAAEIPFDRQFHDLVRVYTSESFESSSKAFKDDLGNMVIDSENSFTPGFTIPFNEITSEYYGWILGEVEILPEYSPKDFPFSLVFTFEHDGKPYKYRALDMENQNLKIGEWNKVNFRYLTPEVRKKDDLFKTYFWNRSKNVVRIKNYKIKTFKPKINQ